MQRTNKLSRNPTGRPRSSDVTARIHAALWRLLETQDFRQITMEKIALEAGVSRPALYRRYSEQGQAFLGALLDRGSTELTMPYTDNLPDDLQLYFNAVVKSLSRSGALGKALRGVLSAALIDDDFVREFESFIRSRREPVVRRLASQTPKLSDERIEIILDEIFGPVLYSLLIRGASISPERLSIFIQHALLN